MIATRTGPFAEPADIRSSFRFRGFRLEDRGDPGKTCSACLSLSVLLSCNELRKRPARGGATHIMASEQTIRVAIVGLGFGAEFIPIYQNYPGAEISAICRRSQKDLDECGDRWKIARRYKDFAQ